MLPAMAGRLLPLHIPILLFPATGLCITPLDDAIKESYVMKEQEEFVKRSRFSYISSIDPSLPQAQIGSSYIRTISPMTPISTYTGNLRDTTDSRDAFTFTGSLSWRVFDGGERWAKRKGAFAVWEREKERFKSVREDVVFNVKNAFYVALGAKSIVGKRQEALEAAQKIHNLTRGRYEEGVAKKSELLQAEVRFLNARIDLQKARKEYEKSLESVRSLIIVPVPDPFDVEGPLSAPTFTADYKSLNDRALATKPEIITQQREIDRLMTVYDEKKSAWYPKIDTTLQQTRCRTAGSFLTAGRTPSWSAFPSPLRRGWQVLQHARCHERRQRSTPEARRDQEDHQSRYCQGGQRLRIEHLGREAVRGTRPGGDLELQPALRRIHGGEGRYPEPLSRARRTSLRPTKATPSAPWPGHRSRWPTSKRRPISGTSANEKKDPVRDRGPLRYHSHRFFRYPEG